ncbi:MAG: polysaccharide biosynthesis/export family protein [Nitrospirae bacterium]|nr:polysaccharide biosynthesis/export family protein [Nitrospirota bacterium]
MKRNKTSLLLPSVAAGYFNILLILLCTFSCSSVDTIKPGTDSINNMKAASESEKRNTLILERAINASRQEDYILGPEDLVEIDVFEVDELKRSARISSTGFINLPLIGKINASGLSLSELETEISKRLQQYLQDPIVSVFIREYRSQRITVLGAVKNPQVHNVTRQKFLLDMLSYSGGLADDAGDLCYVQRGGGTVIISLDELLIKGNTKLNIPVFAEDVIHVPKGGIVFVDGAVISPGSFVIKGTVTLTQAIAMAKGLKYEALTGQLRIYRNSGTDAMETIDVDYDAILANKGADFILKDKDVVIVPQSDAKAFLNGFVKTVRGMVTFGGASVGAGL